MSFFVTFRLFTLYLMHHILFMALLLLALVDFVITAAEKSHTCVTCEVFVAGLFYCRLIFLMKDISFRSNSLTVINNPR